MVQLITRKPPLNLPGNSNNCMTLTPWNEPRLQQWTLPIGLNTTERRIDDKTDMSNVKAQEMRKMTTPRSLRSERRPGGRKTTRSRTGLREEPVTQQIAGTTEN